MKGDKNPAYTLRLQAVCPGVGLNPPEVKDILFFLIIIFQFAQRTLLVRRDCPYFVL